MNAEAEIRAGNRFRFGANWTRFLTVVDGARIAAAQTSLREMLGVSSLQGRRFLDIGCGSGLFSLAARSLGAEVHSFDFDPQAVACAQELKQRYFPGDSAWRVDEGSVLDSEFVKAFGIASGKVDDLRAEVNSNLSLELKRKIEAAVKDQVMKALLLNVSVPAPKSLVEQEARTLATRAAAELKNRGIKPEDVDLSPETFRPQAQDRVTLGLIRVVYAENERRVVLLFRPLTLLRFDTPDYVMEADHGAVSWRIKDGLLVAKAGRGSGFLAVDVRRRPPGDDGKAMLHIEVEVANFYPSIAAGFSLPVYSVTQSFIHVLVTHAFLRSLATLHLYESKVGRFASDSVPMPDEVSDGGVSAAEPAVPEAPGITAGQASSRHP